MPINVKSHVDALLDTRDTEAPRSEPREGFAKERPTEQAFALSLRSKDGRRWQGLPWWQFGGYEWSSDGREEQLALIFGERIVEVRGYHLGRLIDKLAEGQLKVVQQHDAKEIDDLRHENAELGRGQHKPVIVSIDVTPPFAETVREIRGDADEHRRRAVGEGRGR